jgi:hypothetical protein
MTALQHPKLQKQKGASVFSRKPLATLFARARDTVRTVAAILCEIFDESAYARFLAREQVTPSPKAYAAFWQEHEAAKARRPRCC